VTYEESVVFRLDVDTRLERSTESWPPAMLRGDATVKASAFPLTVETRAYAWSAAVRADGVKNPETSRDICPLVKVRGWVAATQN